MTDIVSINPATLETVGKVPITPPAKVKDLVAKARAAQKDWARLPVRERCDILVAAASWLGENADELARTITIDNGKPLAEAMAQEVLPVIELLRQTARTAPKAVRDLRVPIGIMGLMGRSSTVERRPCGVVGIIAPWNYPFSIAAGQAAAALAAGNAVVHKPSSHAPIAGGMVGAMFAGAGLPEGLFTTLSGDAETGRAVISARVDKIAFTGSAAVGREAMRQAAESATPLLLELGGKDPMIVRADADIDLASDGAVWGAFTNAGQACASVERCYVHESIFEVFVELCVRKALALKLGNGMDPDVDVGPMTTLAQLEHVEEQLIDARARGANVLCGGERDRSRVGFFMPPTVIAGVDHSFPIMRDETFGPVLALMPFSDDMQAAGLANDSAYGLSASIWTRDKKAARRMAAVIGAGTVMINDCLSAHAIAGAPWGGVKLSGFGRSHGTAGIEEFTAPVHLHECRSSRKPFWWYPYDMGLVEGLSSLARRIPCGTISRLGAIPILARLLRRTRSSP
ncbi:MAG: aldehyde dehydrogenase family protein [Proteobacteria bacterium]|nr:aldehyde dehydrogenase family protein [Pseudomonadota bacterium]